MATSITGRQTIRTRYIGPTNYRGARIKASCEAGSVVVHWDHALDTVANHIRAHGALIDKFGWSGNWLGGADDKSGYVFVQLD